MNIRIHGRLARTLVNGPGERTIVWFQGCSLGCPGCFNPGTHDFAGGTAIDVGDLSRWILDQATRGVTFSGGEPLQQQEGLLALLESLHEKDPAISIGMFTGFDVTELPRLKLWDRIVRHLDFAAAGRYVRELPAGLPLLGSSNQRLLLFSDRYVPADFPAQQVEITIDPSGGMVITGFPPEGMCEIPPTSVRSESR